MAGKNDTAGRTLVATRIFDAPRDLVFEAWTHPNHLSHWWGPNGFSITTTAFDFRPGGVWRLVMHGPDGRDYQNRVVFDEIVPGERLAFHHEPADDIDAVTHSTLVTFEDQGGKTKLTMSMLFASVEELDRLKREYGVAEGQQQTIGRLGEYIAGWRDTRGLEGRITLTRSFAAPRALVFRAFTEAEHLAQWWGPKGFTCPVCRVDPRPGGALYIEMQGMGISHAMTGTVQEAVPNERFVFSNVVKDPAGTTLLEARIAVTLRDEGRGTRLTLEAHAKGSAEIARLMIAGMEEGWSQSLERLSDMLVARAA